MVDPYPSINSSITFYGVEGRCRSYYRDVPSLDIECFECQVDIIACNGAVWILYAAENFGRAKGGVGESQIVYPSQGLPDTTAKVIVPFKIKSAQAFNISNPCLALFEHSKFRGYMYATNCSMKDITTIFKPDSISGLSSAITTSGKWEFWTKPDFKGKKVQVMDGPPAVGLFAANDKVASIKLVQC